MAVAVIALKQAGGGQFFQDVESLRLGYAAPVCDIEGGAVEVALAVLAEGIDESINQQLAATEAKRQHLPRYHDVVAHSASSSIICHNAVGIVTLYA